MESKIQEEMKSSEIKSQPHVADVTSNEIRHEEPTRKSDGISPTVTSPEINLKSPEFNMLLRSKDEIIDAKREQIEHMKEMYTEILKSKDEMLKSKDDELKEVRTALDTVVKQNETLVHQNVFLTRLLTGPRAERAEPNDDMISRDFRDVTAVTPEHDERATEPEPVPTATHETGTSAEHRAVDHHTTPDVHVVSGQSDGEPAIREAQAAHPSEILTRPSI
jgi:hypothetical protein